MFTLKEFNGISLNIKILSFNWGFHYGTVPLLEKVFWFILSHKGNHYSNTTHCECFQNKPVTAGVIVIMFICSEIPWIACHVKDPGCKSQSSASTQVGLLECTLQSNKWILKLKVSF